jgi:hypothetical protein
VRNRLEFSQHKMSSLPSRKQDSSKTLLTAPSFYKYSWELPPDETDCEQVSLSSIEMTKETQASSGVEIRAYDARCEETSIQWPRLGSDVKPKNEEQDEKSQEVPLYVPEAIQEERPEQQLSASGIEPVEFSLHDSLKPALSRETHEEAMKRRLEFVGRRVARIVNDPDAAGVQNHQQSEDLGEPSAGQKQRQVIQAALELSGIVAELKEIDKLSDHESTQLIQRALVLHAVEALEELHAVRPADEATVQKEFYETLDSGHKEATRSLVWKG